MIRLFIVLLFSLFLPLSAQAYEVPEAATVGGKYSELMQVLPCPSDARQYGNFRDYGYWGGGSWCGQQGKAGYWVWVNPNWYVWSSK